jgi:hypothetical protein
MLIADYIEAELSHSIHNSSAKSFMGCRRRYDYIHNMYFYPLTTPKPLEFGVAFHIAMEKLYDPLTWADNTLRQSLAIGAFTQTIDKQYLEFQRKNPERVSAETKADYDERKELGVGMLKYYIREVASKADRGLTPVKVEVGFEVPIKGPNNETLWCKCDRCFSKWRNSEIGAKHHDEWQELYWKAISVGADIPQVEHYRKTAWQGLPVTLGGRLDALMVDQFGRYWVYDWKTAARMSTTEDFMFVEQQITWYLWALRSLGIPVAGFIYAEIRKAAMEEPEPLKRAREGRLFSINRQNATTYEMFKTAVIERDPSAYAAGLYDEYLEFLQAEGTLFHQRFQINRTETELKNAGIDIYNIALEMTNPEVRIYPNGGKWNCGNCAFYDPCVGQNRGEDYMYTLETLYEKKPRHYYEHEKSTDKREGE